LLYITVSVEQYCGITLVDALPENEGILETFRTNSAETSSSSDTP
jgi:hypothetical protein